MLERTMQSAVTAWKNGCFLRSFGLDEVQVENYRAVYVQAFDFGVSDAMRKAGEQYEPIGLAIEDAESDRDALAAA